jgi:DNA-binding transcriptional LysR family regulator
MDIKGLQYFITAAERLNFTSAARECHITQTAMSLHISKMEDDLGFKLFVRNKRGIELTKAGESFCEQARRLIQNYDMSVRRGASIADGVTGVINIMIPSCIEGFVFMDKFREFRGKYPDVELNIQVRPPDLQIRSIKNRQTDVYIGAPDDMEIDPDFHVERIRVDPVKLICSKYHRFAALGKATSDMLVSETVVICEPKDTPLTHRKLRNGWITADNEQKNLLVVSNMDEMLLMIELDRGIGFLPSFVGDRISPETAGVVFVECEYGGNTPTMTTALGYLKDNINPVIKNFIDVLLTPG